MHAFTILSEKIETQDTKKKYEDQLFIEINIYGTPSYTPVTPLFQYTS
jgi:hypothetical protein